MQYASKCSAFSKDIRPLLRLAPSEYVVSLTGSTTPTLQVYNRGASMEQVTLGREFLSKLALVRLGQAPEIWDIKSLAKDKEVPPHHRTY